MKNTFEKICEEKQKSVTSAAFEEFAQYGYRGASTNRLVKTLGISKGSLFKYFDGKLDLFNYLVDVAVERLLVHMGSFSVESSSSPIENIISFAEHEYNYLMENPVEYWFFYRFMKEINSPDLIDIKDNLTIKSYSVSEDLYCAIGISEDKDLQLHLNLIISAYNSLFLEGVGMDSNWIGLKEEYIEGLRKHLSYVKWR